MGGYFVMEKAKVYFTDFRVKVGTSLLDKLKNLCIKAGFKKIDMTGKFVAIKMHFGELGNLAFIRPQYVKVIADLEREQGGYPFITDCNTLYPGSRKQTAQISTALIQPLQAVKLLSATVCAARTRLKFLSRTANLSKKQKSVAQLWTQIFLSVSRISKVTK